MLLDRRAIVAQLRRCCNFGVRESLLPPFICRSSASARTKRRQALHQTVQGMAAALEGAAPVFF